MSAVVRAESLTKRFGEVLAVADLSFTLQAGTITGFLGPNGAGKTTTLRMLLGLATPMSCSSTVPPATASATSRSPQGSRFTNCSPKVPRSRRSSLN